MKELTKIEIELLVNTYIENYKRIKKINKGIDLMEATLKDFLKQCIDDNNIVLCLKGVK